MIQVKEDKGITLVTLVITIIVMMIIAGVATYSGTNKIQQAEENKALSEVQIVQHAVLEAYTKYVKTKDATFLVGAKVEDSELTELANTLGIALVTIPSDFDNQEKAYYRLTPGELEKIGINESKDTYIVNYLTGEVINETLKKTESGKVLYVYAINDFSNDDVTAF